MSGTPNTVYTMQDPYVKGTQTPWPQAQHTANPPSMLRLPPRVVVSLHIGVLHGINSIWCSTHLKKQLLRISIIRHRFGL